MSRVDRGHVAQAFTAACGVWLMASPDLLGYGAPLAHSDHIAGPLLVTTGSIAVWEITRPVRWAAFPVGVWLLVAPWILGASDAGILSNVITGLAVVILGTVRGAEIQRFGGGWSAIWTDPSPYRDLDTPEINERN